MFLRISSKFQGRVLCDSGIIRQSAGLRKLSADSNEYQYIDQSKISTDHFQKSLPRLPIPKLEKTCERYLRALKPLLTENEYNSTEKVVSQFKENEGKILDDELRRSDFLNSHTSYISKPWFHMYLSDRTPLPINYNPVLIYNKSNQSENDSQVVRAANMLISSLRFMKSLRKNILSPDVFHLDPKKSDTDTFRAVTRLLPPAISWYGAYFFKAFPLDMSQYGNLFNSTRIPKLNADILYKDETAKHILVIRKGHFFIFDVLDRNGDILPPQDIYACLKHISEKDLKPNTKYLGYFTTENRDVWAKARQHVENLSQDNFKALRAIDSSLFVICLDDVNVEEDTGHKMKVFLHGNGFNRWFDKSFSLIFAKDGSAALNFEHSWGDGVAVLRYFQDIYKDTNTHLFVSSNTATSHLDAGSLVRELTFTYDDRINTEVEAAKEKIEKICKSLDINLVQYYKLGKPHCKKASVSPDSIMQLAFQVAFHKAYGNFVATYESCSTAAYKHGRTETIRPCTIATKEFALGINGGSRPDHATLCEMMKKCSSVHGNLAKEAAMGEGFDRHLFGLRDLAIQIGSKLSDLYTHDSYKKINYNILSTSTLSSDAVFIGGFGPVVPDGLGVGYVINNEKCGAVISSYSENRNGSDFAKALEMTFSELAEIINGK